MGDLIKDLSGLLFLPSCVSKADLMWANMRKTKLLVLGAKYILESFVCFKTFTKKKKFNKKISSNFITTQ